MLPYMTWYWNMSVLYKKNKPASPTFVRPYKNDSKYSFDK